MFMETITNTNWQNKPTRQQNRKYWLFSVLFAGSGRRFNIQTARKNLSHWKSGPFSSDYLRENFQYFDRSGYIKFSRTDEQKLSKNNGDETKLNVKELKALIKLVKQKGEPSIPTKRDELLTRFRQIKALITASVPTRTMRASTSRNQKQQSDSESEEEEEQSDRESEEEEQSDSESVSDAEESSSEDDESCEEDSDNED